MPVTVWCSSGYLGAGRRKRNKIAKGAGVLATDKGDAAARAGSATASAAIWALSDGRAGNRAQALGLAEAVSRATGLGAAERIVEPGAAARLPAWAWHALGHMLPGWPEAGLAAGSEALRPPWPRVVIGAGRRVAPLVAALGRRHGMRTVQCLTPQMPLSAFDMVVAPDHDRLEAPNAVATLGSVGRVTPQRIAAETERLAPSLGARAAALPRPRIAVLVGGPGRAAGWGPDDGTRLISALIALTETGHGLIVTYSRRTEPSVAAGLADALDPARAIVHTGEGENPYPAMLGLADAVIVTADSVNMASEAACTGLPIHVFHVAEPAPKARVFHSVLEARGIARPYEREIGAWAYQPLAEADRVALIIAERLLG